MSKKKSPSTYIMKFLIGIIMLQVICFSVSGCEKSEAVPEPSTAKPSKAIVFTDDSIPSPNISETEKNSENEKVVDEVSNGVDEVYEEIPETSTYIPNTPIFEDEKINEFNKEYLEYVKPADDSNDYRWANDFSKNDISKMIIMLDSKGYEEVFGFKKPSLEELETAINNNEKIDTKYREPIISFLREWLLHYPETDFSVLMYNLQTLEIREVTADQMKWEALSGTAIACYRPIDNIIYVNVKIDLSDPMNDDTIVFRHEFIHASRTMRNKVGDYSVSIRTYPEPQMGLYYDEAVMTNFLYKIRGKGEKSQYYRMAANYYRIIMDCLGDVYTGTDYFNHSINYFASKMDKYMGNTDYALHILSLIDVQMGNHYKRYMSFKLTDFSELYEYITYMYMKKNIKTGMSEKEREQVFKNFISELTANIAKDDYEGIEEASFRPYFIKYCENLE